MRWLAARLTLRPAHTDEPRPTAAPVENQNARLNTPAYPLPRSRRAARCAPVATAAVLITGLDRAK